MLREGPIPVFVHGVVEYLAAILLIAAPFIFGFDSSAAIAASIVLGLAVLAVTAVSVLPTGIVKRMPVGVHVTVDIATAVVLVAVPFLFGFFRDEAAPTAFFITLGVVHLLLTIATRFPERRGATRA